MTRLADPDAALRLARAIIADVLLYQELEINYSSPAVAQAVEEARHLFGERVVPPLHDIFDRALAETRLAPWGGLHPSRGKPIDMPPLAAPSEWAGPRAPKAPGAVGMSYTLVALALAILLAVAAVYVSRR